MPDWEAKIRERLAPLRLDPPREAEIVEELAQHLDDFYEKVLAEGATPNEAYHATLLELDQDDLGELKLRSHSGSIIMEAAASPRKAAGMSRLFTDLWQDLRFALRSLKKQPGFALLAILALSLGIGCTTVGFGVVENLLFDPYPYKGADRMVMFSIHDVKAPPPGRPVFLTSELLDYRQKNHVFDDMVGWRNAQVVCACQGGAEDFWGAYVTPNTFEFLGVPPLLGRGITPDDGKPGAPPVFVMNYRFWQSRFGGDPKIVGTVFTLDDQPRTLVGIMPPRFQAFGARIWLPHTMNYVGGAEAAKPGAPMLWMMGRLKPGLTMPTAGADLTVVAKQLAKVYDKFYPPEFDVHTRVLNDLVLGDFRGMIYALMAAVMMLLLIACSNVANLLLARATTRDKELAIRSSIGARPGRLVRQLLAESFVLAAAGLVAGCFLAYLGLKAVVANIPDVPEEAVIGLNPVVLFLAIGVTVLTTFLCGLAPALHALRGDLPSRLASGRNLGEAFRNGKLRAVLVVTEVALSMVLLTGAGLMVRSFLAVVRVNPGFDPTAIAFTGVNFAKNSHDKVAQQKVFFQQALERVRTLPGVTAAAVGSSVPSLEGGPGGEVDIPGKTHSEKWFAMLEFASEDYFRTLQVPLVRGRMFTPADIESRQQVVVINQALATKCFGKDDPIGQKMKLKLLDDVPDAPHPADFTIVGVVADFKNVGLLGPTVPEAIIPFTISTIGYRRILMRTTLDPEALMPEVRRAIWAADPNVPTGSNGTIDHWLKETEYKSPRFNLGVLGIFAGIGLALAIVGIFSVMAYTVSLQTHELGIRMALGAQRGDVLRLVLLKGVRLITAGVLAGLLASFGLTRFLASQLWGVSANDSWTYAVVVALIAAAGVAACLLPARKATQVDPIIAIRCE